MSKTPSGIKRDDRIGEGPNKGRWVVVRKVGEGGFAEVYEVYDTVLSAKQALKIEKLDKRGGKSGLLKSEHRTLKRLQSSPRVCRLVEGCYGTHDGRAYFVMELLGTNLAQLQRSVPGNRWALSTVCKIGQALLDCLQSMHEAGFIHRDVKPANFVLRAKDGLRPGGEWRAIDFGISRAFRSDSGAVLPARDGYQAFRGSTSYASVNAHDMRDLGRRDDLWSWLYMIVEMLDGALPWRPERGDVDAADKEAAKEMAHELKMECVQDPKLLTTEAECPEAIQQISRHLGSLAFDSDPDYPYLRGCLAAAAGQPAAAETAAAGSSQAGPPDAAWGLAPSLNAADEGRAPKRPRETDAAPPLSPPEKRGRAWSTPQHSPYLVNGASPMQPPQQTQNLQSPYSHQPQELPSDASMADVARLVRLEWLSPQAARAADSVGRLDPAEGVGVIAWLLQQLGRSRLDAQGRDAVSKLLRQLAGFAAQAAAQLQAHGAG